MSLQVAPDQPVLVPAPELDSSKPIAFGKGFLLACEGGLWVVFAHSVFGTTPLYHFRSDDAAGKYMAIVDLARHHDVDVTELSGVFGVHRVTVHKKIRRFEEQGLAGLFPRKGRRMPTKIKDAVERRLLELKKQDVGNSEAARRLGVSLGAVQGALRRLGWCEPTVTQGVLPLDAGSDVVEEPAEGSNLVENGSELADVDSCDAITAEKDGSDTRAPGTNPNPPEDLLTTVSTPLPMPSMDVDPRNRCVDRTLARQGLLDDAAPLFAPEEGIPRVGVLLAIPLLVKSGVFDVAREVYGSLGPAFYGLRTSILALLMMAFLRIKRPEALKEFAPPELGKILGLDRAPEMKTLRGKLRALASRGKGLEFLRRLAKLRTTQAPDSLGFLYADGHVRVYNGKEKIAKAYVMQKRLAMPGTTDYWINDQEGQPLLVITAEMNQGLVKMLPILLEEVRKVVSKEHRFTIVFDRGGWSPKLFKMLIDEYNVHILTYRKGKKKRVPRKAFAEVKAEIDGTEVSYELADQNVKFLGGKLKLRQITRLRPDGKQTQIITSETSLPAAEIAYRMFDRWRQENFFKYMREEFALDALVDYGTEIIDEDKDVPNPKRRELEKKIKAAREEMKKIERQFGAAAFDNKETSRRTMRGFKIANGETGKKLRSARSKLARLISRRENVPKRVTAKKAAGGVDAVKLSTETKRISDTLKSVAYRVESSLHKLLNPHYHRNEEEGRTLLTTAFQSAGDLSIRGSELHVTLARLSSPHRSRSIQALCQELNNMRVAFPGTNLVLTFSVNDPGM